MTAADCGAPVSSQVGDRLPLVVRAADRAGCRRRRRRSSVPTQVCARPRKWPNSWVITVCRSKRADARSSAAARRDRGWPTTDVRVGGVDLDVGVDDVSAGLLRDRGEGERLGPQVRGPGRRLEDDRVLAVVARSPGADAAGRQLREDLEVGVAVAAVARGRGAGDAVGAPGGGRRADRLGDLVRRHRGEAVQIDGHRLAARRPVELDCRASLDAAHVRLRPPGAESDAAISTPAKTRSRRRPRISAASARRAARAAAAREQDRGQQRRASPARRRRPGRPPPRSRRTRR